jgi:ankyrin repeat protein
MRGGTTELDWEAAGWAPVLEERGPSDDPRPTLLQIWLPVLVVGLIGTLLAVGVVFVPMYVFSQEVGGLMEGGTRPCDDPNAGGLRFDAGSGDVDAVRGALAAGRDVDGSADGWTPLLCAAANGRVGAAGALLEAGADPDLAVGGRAAPIAIAAGAGDVALVELLLEAGADPDNDFGGTTPLVEAAEADLPEMVEQLVAGGAEPDVAADRGMTPLLSAAGNPDATEALLAAGADPNEVAAVDGQSVLLGWGLWRLPLSSGAHEPLSHGRGDLTALHTAVLAEDDESVRLLLAAGADPNAVAYDAFTPLHFAAVDGPQVVMDALLAAGADPDLAPHPDVGTAEDLATAPQDEPGTAVQAPAS